MDARYRTQFVPLILACLLASLGALLPAIAAGQTHALRVTLRNVSHRGLADVTIVLRGEDGQELARQRTDATGAASFDDLPAVVRVAVEGQPRSGPPLYQLGDDAQGVRVQLAAGDASVVLDLRVERDGLVLPDPATEVVREEGGPLVMEPPSFPTALVATPQTAMTAATLPSQPVVDSTPPPNVAQQNRWVPWATVLVIALALGLLRLVQRRRSVQ